MATGQTLHDYAPLLDVLQQLTAMAPGLPAGIVAPSSVRGDDGQLHQYLAVHVDSADELLLWKSATGGIRTDDGTSAGDTVRHHRVVAHVLGVRVDVVWIEDLPVAVAA